MRRIGKLFGVALAGLAIASLVGCNSKKDGVPEKYQGTYSAKEGTVIVNKTGAKVVELHLNDLTDLNGKYYDTILISNTKFKDFDYYKDGKYELTDTFNAASVEDVSINFVNATIKGKMASGYLKVDGNDFSLKKAN